MKEKAKKYYQKIAKIYSNSIFDLKNLQNRSAISVRKVTKSSFRDPAKKLAQQALANGAITKTQFDASLRQIDNIELSLFTKFSAITLESQINKCL